ncbi:hypothetical protein [Stenotrophomonas sp.]|uniref:hypothetical protein n=1 Tax=Stenotrophomonas sp. TaxID=69392 RepID=UPI00289E7C16|nr:hypothetical protein [Stenotrophomonas sp.]
MPIAPSMTEFGGYNHHSNVGVQREGAITGLTKREYFAAMAMQGIVGSISSEAEYQRLRDLARLDHLNVSAWIARDAVKQADALLDELERTP